MLHSKTVIEAIGFLNQSSHYALLDTSKPE
jgi:hypothetical protein